MKVIDVYRAPSQLAHEVPARVWVLEGPRGIWVATPFDDELGKYQMWDAWASASDAALAIQTGRHLRKQGDVFRCLNPRQVTLQEVRERAGALYPALGVILFDSGWTEIARRYFR